MSKIKCSGSCDGHVLPVIRVRITGFGKSYEDYYCQAAIAHDRENGFGVDIIEENERRAEFVYESARLAAIASNAPIIPAHWDDREEQFKVQFISVIERQCGETRSKSPEELHGSWMQSYYSMGWVCGETYSPEKRTHPDLVPYSKLGILERDKDSVFVALCEIARQWIYD